MDTSQCYDRVVHSVALVTAKYWGLPVHTISMLLSDLQIITFSLSKVAGYSYISYSVTSDNPFQVLYQGNIDGPGLWICVSNYVIKLLRQRVHSIPLNDPISAINNDLQN